MFFNTRNRILQDIGELKKALKETSEIIRKSAERVKRVDTRVRVRRKVPSTPMDPLKLLESIYNDCSDWHLDCDCEIVGEIKREIEEAFPEFVKQRESWVKEKMIRRNNEEIRELCKKLKDLSIENQKLIG